MFNMKKQDKPQITKQVEFFTQRIVKKWGNSYVVVLNPEDVEILGLEAGDHIGIRIQSIKRGGWK